jgi:hypothetical protein
MFEAIFCGGARALYAQPDVFAQAEVDHIIRLIELDPFVDGVHKVRVVVPPLVLNAFENGAWRITYRVTEPFVEIYSIRRISTYP